MQFLRKVILIVALILRSFYDLMDDKKKQVVRESKSDLDDKFLAVEGALELSIQQTLSACVKELREQVLQPPNPSHVMESSLTIVTILGEFHAYKFKAPNFNERRSGFQI